MNRAFHCLAAAFTIASCAALVPGPALADGKASLYLTRMEPSDVDAKRFSRASWGGGIDVVLPWYAAHNLLAVTSGLEISNMLSHSTQVYDPVIRETLEQRTNQSYGRFFVGGRLGPHGPGFVRPHVGANIALVWYGISTDIDIPNPDDPNTPKTKTLDSNYKFAFGYDVNGGVDLYIANKVPVELGIRHVQSFNVPQQLGEGAVSVSPSYFQTYLAIGIGFSFDPHRSDKDKKPEFSPGD